MRFSRLAEYFERIESTSKRLLMFDIMAELFSETGANDIEQVINFCQEHLAPPFYDIDIGMSEKYVMRTIAQATESSTNKVTELFNELGDLGLVIETLSERTGSLNVSQVHSDLRDIALISGKGSIERKIEFLSNLIKGLSPKEARYVTRFVIGRLRLGIGEPTMLEALAHIELCQAYNVPLFPIPQQSYKSVEARLDAFDSVPKIPDILGKAEAETQMHYKGKSPKESTYGNKLAENYFGMLLRSRQSIRKDIERAFNLCSDLGLVAKTYKSQGMAGIRDFNIKTGFPIRMALCERAASSQEIIEKTRDKNTENSTGNEVAIEAKYDGIRCQIHKDGDTIDIFSRNLERMTHMYPDIVTAAKALPVESMIFEGEALAYNEDTGELLPFQVTMQRRRKHNVDRMAQEFPLKLFAFELLYLDGKDYTEFSYEKRHLKLDEIISRSKQGAIETALRIRTDAPDKIDELFDRYIETGLEGIIAKRLAAPYIAGSRNFNWIKLKRSYKGELADSVDLCIIGFFRGKGARTKFGLGALLGAVYDPDSDTFKSISKIGTGFTEKNLQEYFRVLDEVKLSDRPANVDSDIVPDIWVEPRYVITVTADEITRSPNHTAGRDESGMGYALRFPRAEGLPRADKSARDANTVQEIIRLFEIQSQSRVK